MGRKLLGGCLIVVTTLLVTGTGAWAVESGLAGVKIDQSAIDLLKPNGLGEPAYIGPTGATIGGGGAGSPAAAAPSFAAAGGGAGVPSAAQMYWLYPHGGETLVVGIRSDGSVASVQVTGVGGLARTVRGIGLGSPYQRMLAAYGFPDQTINVGNLLVVRYQEDGLTFTLANMTVDSILLEAVPSGLIGPSAPTAAPQGGAAPGAPGAPPSSADSDYERMMRD